LLLFTRPLSVRQMSPRLSWQTRGEAFDIGYRRLDDHMPNRLSGCPPCPRFTLAGAPTVHFCSANAPAPC
jgi:hypothetical protein